jgi:hypothetical protein
MQGDDFLCKRHPDAVSFRMLFLLSAVEQGENLFFFYITTSPHHLITTSPHVLS